MEAIPDVPYRCPRCSGTRTFSTLAELKSHMAEEHAYSAQKRQRLRIFDYSPQHNFLAAGRHSPLLQSLLDEGQRLEQEVKTAKQEEIDNQLQRQKHALSQPPSSVINSFSDRPAAKSPGSPRKPKVIFRTPLQEPDSYLQESFSHLNHEMLVERQQHWRTADALYTTQDVLSGVEEAAEGRVSEQKNFILELTQQLAEKEQQLFELRTQLEAVKQRENEKDQDETDHKAKNSNDSHALDNIQRERQLIEDELLKKKSELEKLNRQLMSARQNKARNREEEHNRKSQEPPPIKKREKTNTNKTQRTSKESRSADISSLNSEWSDASTAPASAAVSRTSSSSAKIHSNHTKKSKQNSSSWNQDSQARPLFSPQRRHTYHIHNKLRQEDHQQPSHVDRLHSQKLREERQLLVQQMKDLLLKANTDNEKLKDELMAKENHVQYLNQELERSKTDQTELMEETYDLYKEAEKSLAKLKDKLKAKESELEQANVKMDEIRSTHEKLVTEKETVEKSAGDKDILYLNMMSDRDEEIQTLKGLLVSF